jgi:rhodanese-related sulfurtransferase
MNIYHHNALMGFFIIALTIGSGLTLTQAWAADVPLMTTDELKAALGGADLVILDARAGKDWKSSEFKIQGAVRAAPGKFKDWGSTYDKGKKIVLYCA